MLAGKGRKNAKEDRLCSHTGPSFYDNLKPMSGVGDMKLLSVLERGTRSWGAHTCWLMIVWFSFTIQFSKRKFSSLHFVKEFWRFLGKNQLKLAQTSPEIGLEFVKEFQRFLGQNRLELPNKIGSTRRREAEKRDVRFAVKVLRIYT